MKKAFNLQIALFPILSGYGLSLSLDFGSLLLFIFGVGCIITYPRQFKIKLPIGYSLFFVVAFLLSLAWVRSLPLRLLLFSVNLCFACCYAEKQLLWKLYGTIVWVCIAFFFVQEASFSILGVRPSGILPFLPTVYGGDNAGIINETATGVRSSSFFLEPSYFAQFLIPYVVICLFSSKVDERKKAIIVSFILLLVRSGIGILLLGIIWLLWLLLGNIKASTKVTAFVLIIMTLCALFFADNSISEYFLDRSSELLSYSGEEQYQSSGFIRIFRGYFAFSDLPTLNKLLGTHPSDVQSIFDRSLYFGTESTNFINGMQTLLFYHGIIGTFIYLRHILLLPYNTRNKTLLVLSISIIVLLLLEQFYLSSRLFVMMAFMHLMREEMKRSRIEISPN